MHPYCQAHPKVFPGVLSGGVGVVAGVDCGVEGGVLFLAGGVGGGKAAGGGVVPADAVSGEAGGFVQEAAVVTVDVVRG